MKTQWSRASCKENFFDLADKKCLLHFLLFVMLFALGAKRSNSRSQIFFKTGVLKTFARFTEKNLCCNRFLIRFQYWRPACLFKKRLQHRRFMWILRIFQDRHFYRRSVHYTLPKFFLMIDNWYFTAKFYYTVNFAFTKICK